MKPKCIEAVQAVAAAMGRGHLTANQIADLDTRMARTMRNLAQTEEGWAGLSRDQQLSMAADRAMKDIAGEAARKVQNANLQILRTVATQERMAEWTRLFDLKDAAHALYHDMDQVSKDIEGMHTHSVSRMMDLLDAVTSGKGATLGRRAAMFLFDADNPQMTRDLAHEIIGEANGSTGNKVAQEGAKAWLKVIEELRTRFNAAGGDIGKLDYGYVPTPHSAGRVRGNNTTAAMEKWVGNILPKLDRSRYVDDAGTQFGDGELRGVLSRVWETIKSEGLNKQEPGAFKGDGARANKGSDHRELHFKDAESYLDYLKDYGRGSMLDAMQGHVGRIVRDIGLVEAYGPNPNAQMRLQMDLAIRADGEAKRVGFGVGVFRPDAEGLWRTLNGTASSPANELAASIGKSVRDVQGFKLAGTLLKSFPDVATYFVTTGYNKLPYWQAIANLGRVAASAETREWAAMHGILSDSAMRALNRYSAENIRQTWAGRLSNSVMKLSVLNAWTDWLSAGFGLTKMGALGKLAGKDWGDISQWDRILMERHGVTADDWSVVRQAQTEERNGIPMLTPDSIVATGHERAYQVADKILGLIKDETSHAVIKPDLMTRTVQTWNGTQAGTGLGEFARATMLFKSFPIAMITRHWRRMMDMPTVTDGSAPWLANRGIYMGALMVSTTALGAISLQASNIVKGRDPIDMFGKHAEKFWTQAFAIGGGGGFYSDLLTRDSSQDRSAMDAIGKGLGGPVLGDLSSLYQLTKGNIDDKIAGKQTHALAEGVQMARSHTPYLDLWYAKSAIDHMGMHALQENLSPGYLGKMQARAQKDWGQDSWWKPGSGGAQRAPDLAKAVGR